VKASSGFTLLELMVVVVIVGLLAVAGVPSLLTWIGNTRVRGAADDLQNGMRLAQVEAVRRNAAVTLMLVDDPAVLRAVATGVNWAVVDGAGHVIQSRGNSSAGLVVQTPTLAGGATFHGRITFDGLGLSDLPAPVGFRFSARSSDHELQVLVTPAGRVRLCDPGRGAGDPQSCE
jgi:type IV fimbrial biogenesis protein FimT